jgi:hypothetical protein
MTDYELGTQLRSLVLADQQRGQPPSPRRLQAIVADLCGACYLQLLAPLTHLVQTPTFLQSLQQQPALPQDHQLALALQQELDDVFATAINHRMILVIRGLLRLPIPNNTEISSLGQPAAPSEPARPQSMVTLPISSDRGVVALLSFIAGILLVAVVFGITWLSRDGFQSTSEPAPSQPEATPLPPPKDPGKPPLGEKADSTHSPAVAKQQFRNAQEQPDDAAVARAISTVRELYRELSAEDYASTARRLSPVAADQFDPAFFAQFERVNVADLAVVEISGERVDLQGMVTFTYPDGTTQRETRSYTVDTASDTPLIVESAFGRVVRPRQ